VTTRAEAIAAAAQIASRAWAELAEAYAGGGPGAVAAIEREPGASGDKAAAAYQGWVREELAKKDGASAA
jgi:hypothetical protein